MQAVVAASVSLFFLVHVKTPPYPSKPSSVSPLLRYNLQLPRFVGSFCKFLQQFVCIVVLHLRRFKTITFVENCVWSIKKNFFLGTAYKTAPLEGLHTFLHKVVSPFSLLLKYHVPSVKYELRQLVPVLGRKHVLRLLERGKEREGEKHRLVASVSTPGTEPTTSACALTGNPTSNPLVHRTTLNQLSRTGQS